MRDLFLFLSAGAIMFSSSCVSLRLCISLNNSRFASHSVMQHLQLVVMLKQNLELPQKREPGVK